MRGKLLVILACAVLAGAMPAAAQTYPERPVTFIVPYGAGGPLDTVARIITERMRVALKQSIVIENVAGASGTIGVGRAVRAAPDGYTVCVGNWPTHVVNGAMFNLAYDLVEDFEPVALLTSNPYIMLVRKNLPAKNVAELIALAKSRPGFVTYGTSGPGGAPHLAAELLKRTANIDMTHIPYKASAQSFQDLLGGQVMVTMDSQIQALPYIRDNRLRALGVLSARRVPSLPDVPTIAETVPGYELTNWFGLVAPAATPKDVLAKISGDVHKALQDQGLRDKITALSAAVVGDTPEQFGATMRADSEKWARVIREANIKAE